MQRNAAPRRRGRAFAAGTRASQAVQRANPAGSSGSQVLERVHARLTPAWPLRLPRRGSADGVLRVRGRLVERLLHVDGHPVLVRAWDEGTEINLLADALDPALVIDGAGLPSPLGAPRQARGAPRAGDRRRGPGPSRSGADYDQGPGDRMPASEDQLERAIERMRFVFGIDDDLRPFYERFRHDQLLGPAIRHQPWGRPSRRPDPWEALAWAVTEQLIEATQAHAIQRRILRRWGTNVELELRPSSRSRGRRPRAETFRDLPCAALIAGRAPAELAAMDLAPSRALALVRAAREVAAGRADLADPASDARLLKIPGIGPWTVALVGLAGRGDPDALPAGDLAYIKVIGRLAGLGRRATVPEVEEFFRPYAPYRGLAGTFVLREYHKLVASGPPPKIAA